MKKISLLGSTGSIGNNVLEVVRKFPGQYQILAMAAGRNLELFQKQIKEFQPRLVSVIDEEHADQLRSMLSGTSYIPEIVWGVSGSEEVAAFKECSITISAIVGAAGLMPTLAAIEAGKDVGLANKETLVMAGQVVMDQVERKQVNMLPVDSEHSAVFQALHAGKKEDIHKIILTASGGPFHGKPRAILQDVTRNQALAHPNWSMGQKISIDSATLMNKGLEVIEAKWLFDIDPDEIEVVVHPQSIVHSLVEYHDGSIMAHLGVPDMRIPIAYALSYPDRLPLTLDRLSLSQCAKLEFVEPDFENFPALKLAFNALRQGGTAPAILNGANEIAVAAFLEERIAFLDIAAIVSDTLDKIETVGNYTLQMCLMQIKRHVKLQSS